MKTKIIGIIIVLFILISCDDGKKSKTDDLVDVTDTEVTDELPDNVIPDDFTPADKDSEKTDDAKIDEEQDVDTVIPDSNDETE
ncbi:MAG TPA: hypothetical protein PKG52_03720, partial [bacterium]|nr:hypothetical protein [bacterium]